MDEWMDEIFMDYGIFKEGESPNGWTSIHATKTEDGKWVADNINLNILEGLENMQRVLTERLLVVPRTLPLRLWKESMVKPSLQPTAFLIRSIPSSRRKYS